MPIAEAFTADERAALQYDRLAELVEARRRLVEKEAKKSGAGFTLYMVTIIEIYSVKPRAAERPVDDGADRRPGAAADRRRRLPRSARCRPRPHQPARARCADR